MKKKVLIKEMKESVDDTKLASTRASGRDRESRPKRGVPNVNPAIVMRYSSLVNGVIRERWNIPTTIPLDGSLEVTIDFKIDEEGRVGDVEIVEASGNRTFDKFCVQAVYKAAPLPVPPAELLEDAKYDGLEIKFRNERWN